MSRIRRAVRALQPWLEEVYREFCRELAGDRQNVS